MLVGVSCLVVECRGLRGESHSESWSELILVVVENAMVFELGSVESKLVVIHGVTRLHHCISGQIL